MELSENPCLLLTDAEVAQAMGTAAVATPEPSEVTFAECKWGIPEQPLSRMLLLFKPVGGRTMVDLWARYPADYPAANRRDVGDAAVWDPKLGSLQVVVGGVQFSVGAWLSPDGSLTGRHPSPEAEVLRLARLVASRVQGLGE